ncbi:hypothetical protein HOG17_01510 [Candidatus Peregrinibacteria bacterium]|jgi:hypothetical protein|nr:hypothetical protein [Candidatus Peregrinibacteria bacterium]MBT4148410.1 hypothetical protein [Candidatus Peregrinibacteria bacterium]MBT4366469.1 hypothetical protein [Candidatus Peregrinibacteria bacterium]MBT4456080.1 hypothetical protein [Candidatus Peregrinibacteria bacterium]
MRNIIKKLVASIIVAGLLLGASSIAFAADTATESINALKNLEFNVNQHLNLGQSCEDSDDCPIKSDGEHYACTNNLCDVQQQSYFGDDATDDRRTAFPIFRFILDVIETLTKISGTIAVIMLILTGFVMIFSQGNQNMLEKAKQMFLYSVLGIIIILLSYVMVTLVQSIFTL